MFRLIKKLISSVIDFILYRILSERQKRFLANLFSEKQKDKIKQVTKYGKRNNQKKLVKQVNTHLYSLGFTERAQSELHHLLETHEDDMFMKRLVSFELALWHANEYSDEGAEKSLHYLQIAEEGERDQDQLRRIAILKAECYDQLQQIEAGRHVIETRMSLEEHPDLYLAMANLEASIDERLQWMNQAMDAYDLQQIHFHDRTKPVTYDDLQTMPIKQKVSTGPKVSVLLPAYNAEDGIQIAIESILSQTWENLELLIVDDCSSDHTVAVIEQYMQKDNRVKLFSTPKNSGPYIARNIGLQHATGEFVTVNDADDWSHAEKIEIQANHLVEHPKVIANTSEHARLTEEDLKLYRRGTPGRYIFSNMSSLMFRREPVSEVIGYWDSVRFAADGEFKRRLLQAFGEQNVVDLETGPLSLPRQSVSSLTGSSAFGYNGFFMGVRKEYVESLAFFHNEAKSLYYSYPQANRPFPVPEPMWPQREEKKEGKRQFDVIVATDFRVIDDHHLQELLTLKDHVNRVGLIQLYQYDLAMDTDINEEVRQFIDGDFMQMVVYGETVKANSLFIINHHVLLDLQRYVPQVDADQVHVLLTNEITDKEVQKASGHLHHYFGQVGTWYPQQELEHPPGDQSKVPFVKKGLGSLRHYV